METGALNWARAWRYAAPLLTTCITAFNVQAGEWRYSVFFAPSLLAPRLEEYNDALATEGIELIDAAYQLATIRAGSPYPSSYAYHFPPMRYAFGGRTGIAYEFNEDLRGSLAINVDTASSNMTVNLLHSGTNYRVEHSTNLPLACISASLEKVFRFEDDPHLRLHVGGWGSLGILFGQLKGEVRTLDDDQEVVDKVTFSANLDASGWGAGGLAGAEYEFQPRFALYMEGGFGYFYLDEVKTRLDLATVPLLTTNGSPIEIDFSGVFLRIGIRGALGPGTR